MKIVRCGGNVYPEVDFLSSHPGRVGADDRADPRLRSSRCLRTLYSRWANSRDAFACLAYWRHPRGRKGLAEDCVSAQSCDEHALVLVPCADASRATYTVRSSHVSPAVCARPLLCLPKSTFCCSSRAPPTLSGLASADRPETTRASGPRGASAPFTAGGRTAGTPLPASRIGATPGPWKGLTGVTARSPVVSRHWHVKCQCISATGISHEWHHILRRISALLVNCIAQVQSMYF